MRGWRDTHTYIERVRETETEREREREREREGERQTMLNDTGHDYGHTAHRLICHEMKMKMNE